ncbi:hypothetical protein F4825DRAFT_340782 [Nemania diffusa]|nr:hypothetical protein F4825DRAFT_340782 [Nemania diffusa]
MKVWSTLALFVSLSAAAAVDMVVERREVHQPYAFGATLKSAPAVPEDAPADYQTALITLPDALASRDASFQRRDSRKPRGTIAARDFYECATSGVAPKATDCNVVVSNVFATNQALVVAPGACLLFQFGTCWGFFCSLCQQLGTDTDFIGSQLSTAQTLCVSKGSAGTLVGEAAPQWEAGFIRSNGALPNYAGDVC